MADSVLSRLGSLLKSPLADDAMMAELVEILSRELNLLDVSVLLVDPAQPDKLVLRATSYHAFPDAVGNYRQPVSGGLVGRAMQSGRRVHVNNVREDSEYLPIPGTDIMAEVVVPLKIKGRVMGVLNAEATQPVSDLTAMVLEAVATHLGARWERRETGPS